jgi:hypothetical protein
MHLLSTLESSLSDDKAVRNLIASINQNEATQLSNEIYAKFYWNKRNPQWYESESRQSMARLRKAHRILKKRLKTGRVKPELTESGCTVERFNYPIGDTLDFWATFLRDSGWRVVYQESGCSAFWVNEKELRLCTYCEGDAVMMKAPDLSAWRLEYVRFASWYASNT